MRGAWVAVLLASGCLSPPAEGQDGDAAPGDGGRKEPDAGDDAGAPSPCGTLSATSEEFEELSDFLWYVYSSASVADGALELSPNADTTFASVIGKPSWVIEDSALEVHVDVSQMDADALFWVSLWQGVNRVSLRLDSDTLEARVQGAQGEDTRGSVAFDPAMRWWRLSHDGDQFHWATSVDGDAWDDHGSFEADLTGLAAIGLEHTFGGSATTVRVESINADGATAKTCPVRDLVDDFSVPSERWESTLGASCDVSDQDDLTVSTSATDYFCGLASKQHLSLVEERLSVELVDPATCAQTPMLAAVFDGGAFTMTCRPDGGGMAVIGAGVVGGTPVGGFKATYSPVDHRFLAIHHSSEGGVVFETSPDGLGWDPQGTVASADVAGVDLESVEIRVGVSTGPDEVVPEDVTFDQVNAP